MILNSLHSNSWLFCSHIKQYSTHWWKSRRININSCYTYIPSPVSGRCSDKELGPLEHNQILQVMLIDNKQIRMYYHGLCSRVPWRQPRFSMIAKCTGSLHYISPGLEDDLSEYLPQWHESPGVSCHPMPKDSDISKIVQKLKQDHNLANVNPVFGSWY